MSVIATITTSVDGYIARPDDKPGMGLELMDELTMVPAGLRSPRIDGAMSFARQGGLRGRHEAHGTTIAMEAS